MRSVQDVAKSARAVGEVCAAAVLVSAAVPLLGEAVLRVVGVEKIDYLKVVQAPLLGFCLALPAQFFFGRNQERSPTGFAANVGVAAAFAGVAGVGMGIERLLRWSPTPQVSHVLLATAVGGVMIHNIVIWDESRQQVQTNTASRNQVRQVGPEAISATEELWMRALDEPWAEEDIIAFDPPPAYVR